MNIKKDVEALESLWEQRHKSVRRVDSRKRLANELLEAYFDEFGCYPKPEFLSRLADFILAGDLSDKSSNKRTKVEYNFHSKSQSARRVDGTKTTYGHSGEVSFKWAENYDGCGRNCNFPYRKYPNTETDMDFAIRLDTQPSRNKERVRKYREFIRRQPVHKYSIKELNPDE